MHRGNRALEGILLTGIVALTLATGYIHFWVGGILLTLNAAGYLGLAGMVVGAGVMFRRGLPLVLMALAAYAGVTIAGWVVMGPYFDIAYVAKAIEVALIAAICIQLRAMGNEVRLALVWARSLPGQALRGLRGASLARRSSAESGE
ncbi:hypothetical protein BH23CHL7_BH23CHL7_19660 [soil metagenome]